ncbi:hypothetical protein RclHR1_08910005 [Rhizophagus clarus]|uniref:SWIM-type domain-containing protein n=1 Tax=Rhizophagus clarus TaxID=94130 RepID=A0A2Z6S4T9_9GLOM|nr:hypothetical protein RclHR1_08910005 [Rhizophagus clarus]
MNINSNMSNNKCNKRARSSSPDDYKEQHAEYINLILEDSLNTSIFEKKNEQEKNKDFEIEQINVETLIDTDDLVEEMELKLYVGQEFQTWPDAEKFLNEYSLAKGFSIRRKRTETLVENGIKIIIPSPSITLAKHRKLNENMIEFINFCVSHGITNVRNIRNLLSGQFPGRNINQKCLHNAIQAAKKNLTIRQEFDASDMLQYLYTQKANDPRWFIEAKFDEPEHRLCGLIWMSPEQQHVWTRYHDIIFFDTTSRTNRYNMVACFFAAIDNCNRTRLVAVALLEDETEESFVWALEMINKATGNLVPRVVFTDSDPAMSNAISLIYPNSAHCLCLFHIDLNLKKNLRSKLTTKVFQEFRKDFFKCRNTLASAVFEVRWKNLKEKYSIISGYLNRQLDPLKAKWAICYINIQFTAGANSTQQIQQLLDNEANYVRVQEYKDEIPSVGLENVTKRYFASIEKIVSDYLMAPMVIPICKQMQECFYYDAFILEITQWETIIKTHTEDDYSEGVREDHYELAKILFSDIMATITKSEIVEIWRIVVSCGAKSQYVILISDGSHRCTCNLLITHGYPCRHFYKVLRTSPNAKWHIGLISNRWYKDDKIISNSAIHQAPISLCSNTLDNEIISNTGSFDLGHITKIRGNELYTPDLQELNNNRIKYGRAHGMMKKVINLALATNSYEELIGMCQDFLVSKQEILGNQNRAEEVLNNVELNVANPVITVRKGRPAGRVKSAVEIQDKENRKSCLKSVDFNIQRNREIQSDSSRDNRKTCHNCGQKGHNRATCKSTG